MQASSKNNYNIHQNLIKECKRGNKNAQFDIYKLYFKAMYNTCLRIVKDVQEAEDIMQESFLKAFNNLDQYKAEVSFGSWLKKIVINRSLDSLRKKKALFESLEDENFEYIKEEETETEAIFKIEDIKSEINKLPDGYRMVLNLYLLEGYDHEEIGEILNISASTSRSQFARARKRLSENLKKTKNE